MSPEETDFIVGVGALANKIGISPADSVCLFGVLAAALARSDMKHNGTPRELAIAGVSKLFADSLQRAMDIIAVKTLQ